MCRPGQNQRLLYNGHRRYHCIKFQSVVVANDLIRNFLDPVKGKRHGSGMLADPGLLNQLQQHSFDNGGRPLYIYGDPAYPLRVHLQTGLRDANITREEELWNSKMSSVKLTMEWIFGPIVKFFKFLDFRKTLKLG